MVLPKGVYWNAVACKWSKITSSTCPSTYRKEHKIFMNPSACIQNHMYKVKKFTVSQWKQRERKKKKWQTDSQLVKMAFISNEYKEWLEQTKKKRKTYADVYMDPYCSLCRSHHGWSQPKVLTIHLQGFNLFLPADIDVHSSCFFISFTVLHKYNEKNGCRKGDRHICL